jgi:hypothetical protein
MHKLIAGESGDKSCKRSFQQAISRPDHLPDWNPISTAAFLLPVSLACSIVNPSNSFRQTAGFPKGLRTLGLAKGIGPFFRHPVKHYRLDRWLRMAGTLSGIQSWANPILHLLWTWTVICSLAFSLSKPTS